MCAHVVLVFVALGLAFVYAAFVLQNRMVFPGGRDSGATPARIGWDYEDVALPVAGHTTHAWFIPVPQSRGVILFSHGNSGTIADRLGLFEVLRTLRFDLLVYDYGGYGKSTGRPSERRCYADIRTMWRYLVEDRGYRETDIVLFGRSLGGAVTADLAAEVRPGAVVLESTFLSTAAMARGLYPCLPVGPFVRYRFETCDKISRFTSPVLVVHSPDDDIIPYHHGERLFHLAREPKQFLKIRGGHNDGYLVSLDVYLAGLEAFLAPLFPAGGVGPGH